MNDPDHLVVTIGNSQSGLVGCLEKQLKPDWLHRFLEILSVAIKAQICALSLRELLVNIEVNLFEKLKDFLSQIVKESETHRHLFVEKENLSGICILIISVLKYHANILPASLVKCIPIILILRQVQNEHSLDEKTLLTQIQELKMIKYSLQAEREPLKLRMTPFF